MVLVYRGFEGNKVFRWSRSDTSRVTVMFPAEPFFDRCINRVLEDGLIRLRDALAGMHIPTVPFGDAAARRTTRKRSPTLSLNLLEQDGAAA
jgi:hypothetical protein